MKTPKLALSLAVLAGITAGAAIAWFMRTDNPSRPVEQPGISGRGDHRPDFTHAGVNGELWRASDFDGKPTLVNFWATWCAPCVREMPVLQSLADQHAGRFHVVGIAIDEPGEVGKFVDRLDITYPILIGTSDVRNTQRRFGNPGGMLPYSVLLDANGIVRWRHLGELELGTLLEALEPLLSDVEAAAELEGPE